MDDEPGSSRAPNAPSTSSASSDQVAASVTQLGHAVPQNNCGFPAASPQAPYSGFGLSSVRHNMLAVPHQAMLMPQQQQPMVTMFAMQEAVKVAVQQAMQSFNFSDVNQQQFIHSFSPNTFHGNGSPAASSSKGGRKGPGRPKKRKKDDSDDEWSIDNPTSPVDPPNLRSRPSLISSQSSKPTTPAEPEEVKCPCRDQDDVNVSRDSNDACSNCDFWVGRYIVEPCFHYSFCVTYLELEHEAANAAKRHPKCMACNVNVVRYKSAHRATIMNLPLDGDD